MAGSSDHQSTRRARRACTCRARTQPRSPRGGPGARSTCASSTGRALARAEGVEAALLEEWSVSLPELAARSDHAATSNAPKAWRFVGEMEQIGHAFAEQELPDGFSRAAAEIFDRLAGAAGAEVVDLDRALGALLGARDV
jgi:hypothetical protein